MDKSKWLSIVKMVLPLALAASGNEKAAKLGDIAIKAVDTTEALVKAEGKAKLQFAVNLVDIGILGHNTARPDHEIKLEEVHDAVVMGINTAIAVANLLKATGPVALPDPPK